MEGIRKDLESADRLTGEAAAAMEHATAMFDKRCTTINNVIFTEGGGVTIERISQAFDNKKHEVDFLRQIIDNYANILEIKNSQIEILTKALEDAKNELETLRQEGLI